MTLFEISVLGLWVLTFVILVLVLALARQVGVLFERIAPAGALMVNRHLTVGEKAPSFQATTLKGDGKLPYAVLIDEAGTVASLGTA